MWFILIIFLLIGVVICYTKIFIKYDIGSKFAPIELINTLDGDITINLDDDRVLSIESKNSINIFINPKSKMTIETPYNSFVYIFDPDFYNPIKKLYIMDNKVNSNKTISKVNIQNRTGYNIIIKRYNSQEIIKTGEESSLYLELNKIIDILIDSNPQINKKYILSSQNITTVTIYQNNIVFY